MRLYNTLSRRLEKLNKGKHRINLFVCGPTVYDSPHLGHARTYIAFDAFVRYLRYEKYRVFYLQNITDIDDKIIDRAKKENKKPLALARDFEKEFLAAMKKLKVISVDKNARATDHIPQIIKQIKTLIRKGAAYKIENEGYYFDISKFKDYGKLSGRTKEQAEDSISRIDQNIKKRNRYRYTQKTY
jgi:cysteinyl-tRNA synthetase